MTSSETLHVAIIPDGNRRWAKQHGLKGYKDLYDQGIDRVLEITQAAFDHGVTHLSLWGSSHANIADRDGDFFKSIDRLYRDNINKFADHELIKKHDVRIQAIGEWRDSLSPATIEVIDKAIAKTAHRQGKTLTLLLDYSGTRERAAALVEMGRQPAPVTLEEAMHLLHASSWTRNLPEADLIIRTGAWQDPHNSAGFLSLLSDESQYAFPEVLWPDFNGDMIVSIINDFQARERRRGK
jgi:undecaprenyl diphosphate synthase